MDAAPCQGQLYQLIQTRVRKRIVTMLNTVGFMQVGRYLPSHESHFLALQSR
jgi:hypothetical protein